jgi:hypothetical protein
MEDAKATLPWNTKCQTIPQGMNGGHSVAGTRSECERAIAEAETVLRELLLVQPQQATVEPPSIPSAKSSKAARQSVLYCSAPSALDRLRLDPDLDFVVCDEGLIEITEAGVRRMAQAHSAGLDVAIAMNGRELLRFLAPKRGSNELTVPGQAKRSPRPAELSGVAVQHTVAELLEAEKSSELALQMISKERKRYEIESLLPWYATGTLSSSDAERVEQALAEDSVLAQRYELVLEEIAAAIHLNDTLGSPSGRAMEKLFAAIDAEEAHVPYSGRPPQPLTARPATASASG